MARTKQEVRSFLNSQVGQSVNAKTGALRGQCVSLNKALLEFLGVPNPYAARGNAKDVGDNYVKQGIAQKGDGWLRVCVNKSMGRINGVTYGHTWLDLKDEANFEQNGAKALRTTKNTRPIQQAQQIVNLDQWLIPESKTKDSLGANGSLGANQSITSQNGKYTLIMQSDGNLVIYKQGKAIWATNTQGKGGTWVVMQTDGNFVIYTPQSKPVWATNTRGKGGSWIVMQNDGNLVMYTSKNKAVWASNTAGK